MGRGCVVSLFLEQPHRRPARPRAPSPMDPAPHQTVDISDSTLTAFAKRLFAWSCENCADVSSFPLSVDLLRYTRAVLTAKLASNGPEWLASFLQGEVEDSEAADGCGSEGAGTVPVPAPCRSVDLPCEDCGAPSLPPCGLLSYTMEDDELERLPAAMADGSTARALACGDQVALASLCAPVLAPDGAQCACAIAYDAVMLLHEEHVPEVRVTAGGPAFVRPPHPERPLRLAALVSHLIALELYQQCIHVPSRWATDGELATVHSADMIDSLTALGRLGDSEVWLTIVRPSL